MEIISFVNQKGGVSKTTSCVNIGAILGEMGKKVLLIDFDPQGNLTQAVGLFKATIKYSIYDVLCGEVDISHAIKKTAYDNLYIIPAEMNLSNFDGDFNNVKNRENILKGILEDMPLSEYDYLFIDCSPSLSLLTVNALVASESIIIPMEPSIFAFNGLAQLIKVIKLLQSGLNPNLNIKGIFLTRVDRRSSLSNEFKIELKEIFGNKLFSTMIHQNIDIAKAQIKGEPISFYNKNCNSYNDYLSLTKELLKRKKDKCLLVK